MPNRPAYPPVSLSGRAAHGLLASAIGLGLLAAVVAAFQSPLPEGFAGSPVALRSACAEALAAAVVCRPGRQPTVLAAR